MGAPRIHGELLKLGLELSQATVAKHMVRHRRPLSQTWRTFLQNHVKDLVAADFFVVPTVFFDLLFVFVILSHDPASRGSLRCDCILSSACRVHSARVLGSCDRFERSRSAARPQVLLRLL